MSQTKTPASPKLGGTTPKGPAGGPTTHSKMPSGKGRQSLPPKRG